MQGGEASSPEDREEHRSVNIARRRVRPLARRVSLAVAVWLGGEGAATAEALTEKTAPGHNVLLITIGALRADHLGCHGCF